MKKLLFLLALPTLLWGQSTQSLKWLKTDTVKSRTGEGQIVLKDSSAYIVWPSGAERNLDSSWTTGVAGSGTLDSIYSGYGITATRNSDSVYTIDADTSEVATQYGLTQLTLGGLTDVDTTGKATDYLLSWNGSSWVPTIPSYSVGSGGTSFFFDDSASGISYYEFLTPYPIARTEAYDSAIVDGDNAAIDTVLIDAYITDELGGTQVEAGVWTWNIFGRVSSSTLVTTYIIEGWTYTSGGDSTLQFTTVSPDINNTTTELINWTTIGTAISVDPTDRGLVKIWATTTSPAPVTVYFYYNGTEHYSHFHTPIITRHNDLAGLQGGGRRTSITI